ncbi:hypothetical protein [Cohnella caldifontis]|uniref:hypothetical protein n=1 Tax=Cohnella caldifontis TaxID=3027471 RepID=UPI0023ECB460|nr:hypothetical protein [Cohnella sp. YIM B05605]
MKIKVVPLLATAVVTAGLLFGGWTFYRQYAVEKPLDRVAESLAGVTSAQTDMTSGEVTVDLKLTPDADLADIYRKLKDNGAVSGKKLELNVQSDASNGTLEKAWSYSLFDVAESMETHRYTGIRTAMDQLSARFPGVKAYTDMDDDNVYIRLVDGKAAKFVVLPRESATMGVWPNA